MSKSKIKYEETTYELVNITQLYLFIENFSWQTLD